MRTLEEICEEIVVQMAALVTEEGIPTCIQGKDIICFFPRDGTYGFLRQNGEGFVELRFSNRCNNGCNDDKGCLGPELSDKMMCWRVASELGKRMGCYVRKDEDKADSLLSYQFLKL